MRFAVFICGGDGRIFALPYLQPLTGSAFLRTAAHNRGNLFNSPGWLTLDYRAALEAYRHHSAANCFEQSATVALAFVSCDGDAVILETNRDGNRPERDRLADALGTLTRKKQPPEAVARLVKTLAPSRPKPTLLTMLPHDLSEAIEEVLAVQEPDNGM